MKSKLSQWLEAPRLGRRQFYTVARRITAIERLTTGRPGNFCFKLNTVVRRKLVQR